MQLNIVFDQGICWIVEDPFANNNKTPICPRCWDVDKVVVRQSIQQFGTGSGFQCANCNKLFLIL